ncbi:hypothetical protein MANI_028171 [Metarhizium anisopliae]|nr:hypothetical protein MANI_028171 [Metarhizium anisopliae]
MAFQSNDSFWKTTFDGQETLHTTGAARLLDHGSNPAAHTGEWYDDSDGLSHQTFEASGTCDPGYNRPQEDDRGVDVSIPGRRERKDRTNPQAQSGNGLGYAGLEYAQRSYTASGGDQAASRSAGPTPLGSDLYPKTLEDVRSNGNRFDGALGWRDNQKVTPNDLPLSNMPPGALEIGVGQTTTDITSWSGTNQEYSEIFSDRESVMLPPARPATIANISLAPTRVRLYPQPSPVRTTHLEARNIFGSRNGKHKASSPPADDHQRRPAQPGKSEPVNNITDEHVEGSSPSNPRPRSKGIWACPVAKQSNSYYHDCSERRFEDISRVKQHLKRKHYEGKANKGQHEGRNKREQLIVTADHLKQLGQKMTADSEDSWYKVFRIIFPNDSLPSSPYFENVIPQPYAAFAHDLEFNLKNGINDLRQGMSQEVFERLTNIVVSETIRATFQDWLAKSSSGSQSGNSSRDQHDQQFDQQNQETHDCVWVSERRGVHSPMGQSVHIQSHHITRGSMPEDEMPTQQQNNPHNARYTYITRLSQYSEPAIGVVEPASPGPSTYDLPNALHSVGSLGQEEQESFPCPSAELNTGQWTGYPSEFDTFPGVFYDGTTQQQQQQNWEQYQHEEQEQDEETQQQQLQVLPNRNEQQLSYFDYETE